MHTLIELKKLDGGILTIILNDSKRRNALSQAMIGELKLALENAKDDNAIKVIIIAAIGPAFSAGHDLKEITKARENQDDGVSFYKQLFKECSELMQAIVNHPKPVIAEIAGVATAAGCQLVASCDLAISSNEARYATPGVNIGLFCSTPMVALSRNVVPKHAMEMLLTGEMIDAQKAVEIGLVNKTVDHDSLSAETKKLALLIATKASKVLTVGKKAFYEQAQMTLEDAYQYTSEVMVKNMLQDDAKEGIDAFINKRKPEWLDQK